jgi:CheY-like chemotaxis protein
VRKIVEDHGGDIALGDTENGEGAEVTLTSFAQRNPTKTKKDWKMSKNGSLIASEILIVDDEEDIRDLIAGILHDEGYSTRVAGDSDSALAAIRTRRPQLVVLDIWLQGSKLDGIEVLDTIKREHSDLPVVMISGHGTIETAVASIKKGAYDLWRSRSRPTACCMWWNAPWKRRG